MIRFILLLCCLVFITIVPGFSQKKIVLIGSSTTAGSGASEDSLKWAARLQAAYRQNPNDGKDTFVERGLAMSGFNTYNAMPTGFTMPVNRSSQVIDVNRNVTKALSFYPDIIIISLPSNDVNLNPDYNKKETMDNFRTMYQTITAAGVKCFITTTQPRNDIDFVKKQMLKELRDSIINNFGPYTIDFYTDLVTSDGQFSLRPDLSADAIHPNDAGHAFLFQRVMQKNLFSDPGNAPLAVFLKKFTGVKNNKGVLLKWTTEEEDNNTFFDLQKSRNGTVFETVYVKAASGTLSSQNYSWIDKDPFQGKNFYRIRISENNIISYSRIITIDYTENNSVIKKLYFTQDQLVAEINIPGSSRVSIYISDVAGNIVDLAKLDLHNNRATLSRRINLSAGCYFFSLFSSNGYSEVRPFIKAL